jgi:hypothetical protein
MLLTIDGWDVIWRKWRDFSQYLYRRVGLRTCNFHMPAVETFLHVEISWFSVLGTLVSPSTNRHCFSLLGAAHVKRWCFYVSLRPLLLPKYVAMRQYWTSHTVLLHISLPSILMLLNWAAGFRQDWKDLHAYATAIWFYIRLLGN